MRFPVYFKRYKTVVPVGGIVLGADATPTVATRKLSNLDNILEHHLQRPMKRTAIGYWYEGAGAGTVLPVALWIFDDNSGKFYKADSGSLTNGQMTYLRTPFLCDPPQTAANMNTPSHGVVAMIVIADNASGDGTYHFIAGPDSAEF